MDDYRRRKRNVLISGTVKLIVGILLVVVRSVIINMDDGDYYYNDASFLGLLIAGIILIIGGSLAFMYALILHFRPPPPIPEATCVAVPPGQGFVGYPPPLQIPPTNSTHPAGTYPTQTFGVMPGYQPNYPAGAFPQTTNNPNVPPGSIPPPASNFPTEPPPEYEVTKSA